MTPFTVIFALLGWSGTQPERPLRSACSIIRWGSDINHVAFCRGGVTETQRESSTQACLGVGYRESRRAEGSDPTPCQSFSSSIRPSLITPYTSHLMRELLTLKFWNSAQRIIRSPRWIMVAFPCGGKDVRRKDSSGKWDCPALPPPLCREQMF